MSATGQDGPGVRSVTHPRLARRRLLARLVLVSGGTLLAACTVPAPGASVPTAPPTTPSAPAPATGALAAITPQAAPTPALSPTTVAPVTTSGATPLNNTVVYSGNGDVTPINPLLGGSAARSVWELINESLVRPDPADGTPRPWLAESWDEGPDGLTWTFHIRPNVRWSDGKQFTADDVQFTVESVLDPASKSPYRSRFDNVASFDAPNPATFRVNLKAPDCAFLVTTMLTPIMAKHLLAGTNELTTGEFDPNHLVGTGPFMFKEWRRSEYVVLLANPDHWGGRPKLDSWIRRVSSNDQVVVGQLKTGETDYSSVAPNSIAELSTEPHLKFLSVSAPTSIIYIAYNQDRPLFQDKRVRQALTHAMDRQGLIDSVLAGQADGVDSNMPYSMWARSTNIPTFPYNLDAARKLLADAGWSPGPDGILQKDGTRLAFSLLISSGNQARTGTSLIAQNGWRQIGVQLQIEQIELAAFFARYLQAHDFDAVVVGGAGFTLDPDQTMFWSSKEYPNGGNFMRYSNPTVDRLLEQGRASPNCDPTQRKAIYEQMQQIIADEQPATFLYSLRDPVFINRRVQNVSISPWPTAGPYLAWNIKDWTVSN
jgi:peptide/nickel transport system substrate-binding protein